MTGMVGMMVGTMRDGMSALAEQRDRLAREVDVLHALLDLQTMGLVRYDPDSRGRYPTEAGIAYVEQLQRQPQQEVCTS